MVGRMTKTGRKQRGSTALGLLLGVVTGVMILGLAWSLIVANKPQSARPAAPVSATATASASPTVEQSPSEKPSAKPKPKPKPSAITSLASDSYLTVLDSLGKRDVTLEQAQKKADKLSKGGLKVVVIDTSEFPSLNSGYWALVVTDAKSSSEARKRCEKLGRPFGNDCYTRHIP